MIPTSDGTDTPATLQASTTWLARSSLAAIRPSGLGSDCNQRVIRPRSRSQDTRLDEGETGKFSQDHPAWRMRAGETLTAKFGPRGIFLQ